MHRNHTYLVSLLKVFLMGLVFLGFTNVVKADDLLHYNPVPKNLEDVTTYTNRSLSTIWKYANYEYRKQGRSKLKFPTTELKNFHKFLSTYNRISALRYRRVVLKLPSQKGIRELSDFLMRTVWFKRFVIPVATKAIYGYSPQQTLRTNIAAHTASHFFQIPYPTMLCLLFQESKFDFNVRSYTGALGLGQLTSIGIEQVHILRQKPYHEKRIQAAARHLRNIYNDPMMAELIKKFKLDVELFDLGEFPAEVEKFQPDVNSFVEDVGTELVRQGKPYGGNDKLISALVQRILRGDILSGKYAAIHPAVQQVAERRYGKKYGNVLNIETNVLVTAMLLKYYINYKWKLKGTNILKFQPSIQAAISVAAYNQGQATVRKWFRGVLNVNPGFDLEKSGLLEYQPYFTPKSLKKVLRNSNARAREAFEHVWKITQCAERYPTK